MSRTLFVPLLLITITCACATKPPATAPTSAAPVTPRPPGSGSGEQPSPSVSGNATIQVDTGGVEFNPWLRRFTAHVRRNWFVPWDALKLEGRVVVTFKIWKDGRITDVTVVEPSTVESFNHSAQQAIVSSNPTVPLPAEYLDEKAMFTVTFYFNQTPPAR